MSQQSNNVFRGFFFGNDSALAKRTPWNPTAPNRRFTYNDLPRLALSMAIRERECWFNCYDFRIIDGLMDTPSPTKSDYKHLVYECDHDDDPDFPLCRCVFPCYFDHEYTRDFAEKIICYRNLGNVSGAYVPGKTNWSFYDWMAYNFPEPEVVEDTLDNLPSIYKCFVVKTEYSESQLWDFLGRIEDDSDDESIDVISDPEDEEESDVDSAFESDGYEVVSSDPESDDDSDFLESQEWITVAGNGARVSIPQEFILDLSNQYELLQDLTLNLQEVHERIQDGIRRYPRIHTYNMAAWPRINTYDPYLHSRHIFYPFNFGSPLVLRRYNTGFVHELPRSFGKCNRRRDFFYFDQPWSNNHHRYNPFQRTETKWEDARDFSKKKTKPKDKLPPEELERIRRLRENARHRKMLRQIRRDYKTEVTQSIWDYCTPIRRVSKTMDGIDSAAEAITKGSNSISKLTDSASEFIRGFFSSSSPIDTLFIQRRIVDFLDLLLRKFDLKSLILNVIRLLIDLGVVATVISAAITFIQQCWTGVFGSSMVEDPQDITSIALDIITDHTSSRPERTEAGESDFMSEEMGIGIAGTIAAVISAVTVGGTSFLNGNPKESGIDGVARSCRNLWNVSQGMTALEKLASWFRLIFVKITCWVTGKSESEYQSDAVVAGMSDDMKEWAMKVLELSDPVLQHIIPTEHDLQTRVFRLRDQSMNFQSELFKAKKLPPALLSNFRMCQKKCEELYELAKKTQLYQNARIDPFCVSLYGQPGVGKSGFVHYLINMIADDQGKPYTNRVFARTPKCAHWDGYWQPFAVVQDDFGQVIDGEDVAEFMQMKTNTEYKPPMAKLDDKGLKFSSLLLVQTTNASHPHPSQIISAEAIHRRRNALVEVTWADEHRANKIMMTDFTHLKFRFLDPIDETAPPPREWMNVADFKIEIIRRYRAYMKNQLAYVLSVDPLARFPSVFVDDEVPPSEPEVTEGLYEWANEKLHKAWERCRLEDQIVFKLPERKIVLEANVPISVHTTNFRDLVYNYRRLRTRGIIPDRSFLYPAPEALEAIDQVFELAGDECMDFTDLCDWHDMLSTTQFAREFPQDIADLIENWQVYCENLRTLYYTAPHSIVVNIEETTLGCMERIRMMINRHPTLFKFFTAIVGVLSVAITLIGAYKLFQFFMGKAKKLFCDWCCSKTEKNLMKCKDKCEKIEGMIPSGDASTRKLRAQKMITELKSLRLPRKTLVRVIDDLYEIGKLLDEGMEPDEVEDFVKVKSLLIQRLWNVMNDEEDPDVSRRWKGYTTDNVLDWYGTEGMIPSGDASTRKLKASRILTESHEECEAFIDPNCRAIFEGKVRKNLVKATRWVDGKRGSVNGLVIENRKLLVPAHFFFDAKDGEEINIYHNRLNFTFEFEKKRLHHLVKRSCQEYKQMGDCYLDRVIYEMPNTINSFPSIISAFIMESDLPKIGNDSTGFLISRNNPDAELMLVTLPRVRQSTSSMAIHPDGTPFVTIRGFKYSATTGPGDCGGPIMLENKNLVGKIAGFHVSGMEGNGTSCVITQEMLLGEMKVIDYNNTSPPVVERLEEITEEDLGTLYPVPDGRFTIIGKAPRGDEIFQPMDTEIRPSKLHGKVYTPCTAPAALSRIHPEARKHHYDPLEDGIGKNGVGGKDFPQRLIDEVFDFTKEEFLSIDPKYPRDILSVEDAMNGIETERYLERLNMDSSPGFPYTKLKKSGQKGKSAFIAGREQGNLRIVSEELKMRLQQREENAKKGIRVPTTWIDTLKDERRPHGKVHKARVFNVGPVDLTILKKMYFGRFTAWYMKNRAKHSGAVGMNVDCKEWDEMVSRMREVGDRGFDGDYSKYDSKMRSRLICEYFVDLVNAWYDDGEENARVRRVLMEEVAFSVHRAGNVIYLVYQGNNSGDALTSILNCVINDCYHKTGYLYILEKAIDDGNTTLIPHRNLTSYAKYTRAKVYGDDNLVHVSDFLLDTFNAYSYSSYLADFDIEYTPANKGERTSPHNHFTELQFLKRGFRECEFGFYMAPIAKETIQELTNWIRKCPDHEEAMYVNLEDSLRFAFQWGREYYEQHKRAVNAELRHLELPTMKQRYEDYMREYLSQS